MLLSTQSSANVLFEGLGYWPIEAASSLSVP